MYNCGWCGKVDLMRIESCTTDECAMKPIPLKEMCGPRCSHLFVDGDHVRIVNKTHDFYQREGTIVQSSMEGSDNIYRVELLDGTILKVWEHAIAKVHGGGQA